VDVAKYKYKKDEKIQGNIVSLIMIISAVTCLESHLNMIIDKHPTKSEYKKLRPKEEMARG
jgi:hypothetical protein